VEEIEWNGTAGPFNYNQTSRNLKSETLQWREQLKWISFNHSTSPNKTKENFYFIWFVKWNSFHFMDWIK